MPTIVVEVMPKPEILDPQGKAIANALPTLDSLVSPVCAKANGSNSPSTVKSPRSF